MSTQPDQLPKLPALPKLPPLENQCSQREKSVLDEPWRITMLPDDEVPTMVVPSPDAAPPRTSPSLPWRHGDVARLRDDTPEGMMRYIATHSTGWWQEMAERALRDTEKARRMAEESGWQPGQYWTLEVDAEAREKMRAQEEARRAREEEEHATEQAEKEAFARRQLELLKKAGKAPRCEYLYTDGRGCRAPQMRGERWCHGHARMMSYRPEKLELLPMEDEQAVTVNLYRVTKSLLSGRVTEKMGALMLWSIAIAAPAVKRSRAIARDRKTRIHRGDTEARRKIGKHLPQMNADGRRSKAKTSEPQRAQRTRGETGRESTVIHADERPATEGALRAIQILQSRQNRPRLQDDELRHADHAARGFHHSGVTTANSFRSGMGRERGARSGDPVIGASGDLHPSTRKPRVPGTPGDRKGKTLQQINADARGSEKRLAQLIGTSEKQISHSSVPRRLRGENIAGSCGRGWSRGGVGGRQNCVFPRGRIIL